MMGCQLSKDQLAETEEEVQLNRQLNTRSKTHNQPQDQDRAKNSPKVKHPWNILERIKQGGISIIKNEAEREDPCLSTQCIDALKANSPPEFGFTRVLKILVTGEGFTPGALKNIIVLSEGKQECMLIIRVYSVKAESLHFVFHNSVQIELNTWDSFGENNCWFEVKENQLTISESDKRLYSIKLDKNGTKPKEIDQKLLKSQTKWVGNIKCSLEYHSFEHNRVKNAINWSKICLFEDLFEDREKANSELKNTRKDPLDLIFLIGDLMKSGQIPQDVLRTSLLLMINIPDMLVNKMRQFKQKYPNLPIPDDRPNGMDYSIIYSEVQQVKKGVISITVLDKEFVYCSIINTHQKKVIVEYLVTVLDLVVAYCEDKDKDPLTPDPNEVTDENSMINFFNWFEKLLLVNRGHFDPSSRLLFLKLAGGLIVVDPKKDNSKEKLNFFELPKTQLRTKSSSALQLHSHQRRALLRLKFDLLETWYKEVRHKERSGYYSFDYQRIRIKPLMSKLYDLTDPEDQENVKVLIVNDKEAVILKERGRCMIDEISFKYELVEVTEDKPEKVRNLGGFCQNLIFNKLVRNFSIFELKHNKNQIQSVFRTKKINLLAMLRGEGEDDRESFSKKIEISCFKKLDGSIVVLYVRRHMNLRDLALLWLEIDEKTFRIKNFKSKTLTKRPEEEMKFFLMNSFLVAYISVKNIVVVEDKFDYFYAEQNSEYRLMGTDLEVLDTVKIPLHGSAATGGFLDSLLTVENNKLSGEFVIKKWGVSTNKKKFKLVKTRVLNNVRLRGLSINNKGICLFRAVPVDEEKLGKEGGVQGKTKIDQFKMYTFDLNLRTGIVVDLGYMDQSQRFTGHYISNKKVHVFKGLESKNPWFSITYTDNLEESPIVESIRYGYEEN